MLIVNYSIALPAKENAILTGLSNAIMCDFEIECVALCLNQHAKRLRRDPERHLTRMKTRVLIKDPTAFRVAIAREANERMEIDQFQPRGNRLESRVSAEREEKKVYRSIIGLESMSMFLLLTSPC